MFKLKNFQSVKKFLNSNFISISYPLLIILSFSNYWNLCKVREENKEYKNLISESNLINIRLNDLASEYDQTKIKLNNLTSENDQTKIRLNDLDSASTQTNISLNNLAALDKRTKIKLNNLASENNQAKIKLYDLEFANTKTNIRLGKEALFSLDEKYCTKGKWNVAIGPGTQHTLCNGTQNIAVGRSAQYVLNKGTGNIAIGIGTQRNLQKGLHNIGLGNDVMYLSKKGYKNIAIGNNALRANLNGADNIAIGYLSGYDGIESDLSAVNTSKNTWIGNYTGKSVSKNINESIAIGHGAKNDKSNQVVIGNKNIKETTLNGNVLVDGIILKKGNIDLIKKINMLQKKVAKLESKIKSLK